MLGSLGLSWNILLTCGSIIEGGLSVSLGKEGTGVSMFEEERLDDVNKGRFRNFLIDRRRWHLDLKSIGQDFLQMIVIDGIDANEESK